MIGADIIPFEEDRRCVVPGPDGRGFSSWRRSARRPTAPTSRRSNRRAPKEPAYTSKRPLYGLLVFGPEAKAHVWMVLDRSKQDAGPYDILYVDLDADGDLTGPGERLAGQVEGDNARFQASGPEGPGHRDRAHELHGAGDRLPDPTVMVSVTWPGEAEDGRRLSRGPARSPPSRTTVRALRYARGTTAGLRLSRSVHPSRIRTRSSGRSAGPGHSGAGRLPRLAPWPARASRGGGRPPIAGSSCRADRRPARTIEGVAAAWISPVGAISRL